MDLKSANRISHCEEPHTALRNDRFVFKGHLCFPGDHAYAGILGIGGYLVRML